MGFFKKNIYISCFFIHPTEKINKNRNGIRKSVLSVSWYDGVTARHEWLCPSGTCLYRTSMWKLLLKVKVFFFVVFFLCYVTTPKLEICVCNHSQMSQPKHIQSDFETPLWLPFIPSIASVWIFFFFFNFYLVLSLYLFGLCLLSRSPSTLIFSVFNASVDTQTIIK